jgi:uncharacterized Zn-binding protein involved in type VI secretion
LRERIGRRGIAHVVTEPFPHAAGRAKVVGEETAMPPAARVGDQVLQSAPHCHAPIHPAALVPTPVPHPALPLAIIPPGCPTVLIGGQPAARIGDMTQPCMLPGCIPAGPGVIVQGSATVMIGGQPAARLGDQTAHASCVAPIPSPTGQIIPACCPTVMIGG